MADIRVKICGLRTPSDVEAVARAGAAYAGFVFFAKSPRNLSLPRHAVPPWLRRPVWPRLR